MREWGRERGAWGRGGSNGHCAVASEHLGLVLKWDGAGGLVHCDQAMPLKLMSTLGIGCGWAVEWLALGKVGMRFWVGRWALALGCCAHACAWPRTQTVGRAWLPRKYAYIHACKLMTN